MRSTFVAVVAVLASAPFTAAHSWIQQLRNVDEKGNYVGEWGYPRGYCAKGDSCDPGIVNSHLLPDPTTEMPGLFISEESVLCKASQQKAEQLNADKYPRLKAVPGMHIALRYSENGHVSLNGTKDEDTNKFKPSKGGTVFIYGTTNPKEDELLLNVLKWTEDGTGGNGQGVLLGTNDFDDGRCYESNNSPIAKARAAANPSYAMGQTGQGNGMFSIPCESNIVFPKTAAAGKPYTLYWVWQWNTPPGLDPGRPLGKDEYYTTCMDVDVVDTFSSAANTKPKFNMPQQDDISHAVEDFKDRTAIYTSPVHGEVGPIFSGNQPDPGAPSASATPPASAAPSVSAAPSASNILSPPSGPTPTGIPSMSTRPGRPQPSQVFYGNSSAPVSSDPAPTDIPSMSTRPGRPQASQSPAGGAAGNEIDDTVTVTDVIYITVTAPRNSPTTLATAVVSSSKGVPTVSAGSPSGGVSAPTDIPQLSSRPGRPQAQATAWDFPFRGRFNRS